MLNAHIEDIRTFVAVADAKGVSAAARELHLTQSAVTRRVQRVEHAVGARLVDRRHRPFVLTAAGGRALESCRRVLAAAAELHDTASPAPGAAGDLKLGVAHALTELVLVEPMGALAQSWPSVRWQLSTGWSEDLLARLKSGALDAVCVLLPKGQPIPPSLTGTVLGAEEVVVVAPRAWGRRLTTPAQVARCGWVLNPEGCAARAWLRRALGRRDAPLDVRVDAYSYELQMALVARGRGLGLVPRRLLERSASRRQVAALRIRGLRFPFTVWMVTGNDTPRLQGALTALAEALARQLAAP
ncbi:MAG TPA: LysR family transcriptional regulator [Vicinamibacterales bacterium]|nr:LysR family transcriptional regulator [Vicinamibacterales bacterium]